MPTLAQAVRDAYNEAGEVLTWETWHNMTHDERVGMASLIMEPKDAKELL